MPQLYHPLVFALALALVRSAGGVVPSQRRSTAVHNNPLAPADAQFAEVQRGGAARRERAFHLHAMQQRFRRANAEVVAAMESDASAGRRARVTDSLRGAVRAALLMRREESDDALAAGGAVQDDGSLSERGGVGSSSGGEVDASASSLGYADSSSGGAAALAASLPASKFGAAASKEPGGSTDPSLCPPGKRRSALVALLLSLFVGWGSEYLYYGYMWHGLARAVVEAAFLATVRVVSRVRPAATCGVGKPYSFFALPPHPSPSLLPLSLPPPRPHTTAHVLCDCDGAEKRCEAVGTRDAYLRGSRCIVQLRRVLAPRDPRHGMERLSLDCDPDLCVRSNRRVPSL